MIGAWKSQVREVERLRQRYHDLDREEHAMRAEVRHHVEAHWLRGETLLWTAVTGWIWFSRRRDMGEEERGGLLAELLASFWIMQRWRRLTDRAASIAKRVDTESERSGHHPQNNKEN